MQTIPLRIRVFAGIKDAVGAEIVCVECGDGITAGELKTQISDRFPAARHLITASRIAVGHTFVPDDARLELATSSREPIALIPSVSGG